MNEQCSTFIESYNNEDYDPYWTKRLYLKLSREDVQTCIQHLRSTGKSLVHPFL